MDKELTFEEFEKKVVQLSENLGKMCSETDISIFVTAASRLLGACTASQPMPELAYSALCLAIKNYFVQYLKIAQDYKLSMED